LVKKAHATLSRWFEFVRRARIRFERRVPPATGFDCGFGDAFGFDRGGFCTADFGLSTLAVGVLPKFGLKPALLSARAKAFTPSFSKIGLSLFLLAGVLGMVYICPTKKCASSS
jgi:hypothetical protein